MLAGHPENSYASYYPDLLISPAAPGRTAPCLEVQRNTELQTLSYGNQTLTAQACPNPRYPLPISSICSPSSFPLAALIIISTHPPPAYWRELEGQ